MTFHATRGLSSGEAEPLLTRRDLATTIGTAARAAGASGYLLAMLDIADDRMSATVIASNWSFDEIEEIGTATIAALAQSRLTTVPGAPVRIVEAAAADLVWVGLGARLANWGHERLACHRFAQGNSRFVLVLASSAGAGFCSNAAASAQMTAIYAVSQFLLPESASDRAGDALSERERECLFWVSEGKTSDEIATIVGLASSTVNGHLTSAMQKIGAPNRAMAMATAIRQGLI